MTVDIESALVEIKSEIEDLKQRLAKEQDRHRYALCEIEDLLAEVYDKRAVLMAKAEGVEIGGVMVMTRPVRWRGRMVDRMRVKVERITAAYNESEPWLAACRPAIKGGWAKADWVHILPSWAVVEVTCADAAKPNTAPNTSL